MSEPVDLTVREASRRTFLGVAAAAGLGGTLLPGALLGLAAKAEAQAVGAAAAGGEAKLAAADATGGAKLAAITIEMIEQAAVIAGVSFSEAQRRMMLDFVASQRDDLAEVRKVTLPNSVAPAMVFDPVPAGMKLDAARRPVKLGAMGDAKTIWRDAGLPSEDGEAMLGRSPLEALAFLSVRELAELLRTKRVTSTDLTKMYLGRLKRLDAQLHCVITLTEERALKQAAAADAEIAAGKHRGLLHGIPWGAKDLLAVGGYPTTWGAAGFETQTFGEDAEVVKRLDAAGAVLIAKLSMGALAQGDLWGSVARGGRTRNPWNTKQGSSGSSAGSASAVAAGCVGFAIGTETLGSISSPCTRCGVTGLRPSYGMVPRTGAMALSWSMDKVGPIARTVEDAAVVLEAIYGPDGRDAAVREVGFHADFTTDVRTLRVGYLKSAFDAPVLAELKTPSETLAGKELEAFELRVRARKAAFARNLYDAQFPPKALDVLRGMGVTLVAKELPKFPYDSLLPLLEAEAAAAFDELTRSGRDALLQGQQRTDWPNQLRTARLYPAVDYIQAMRVRTLMVRAMAEIFADIDVLVAPSGGTQLTATNLTGHPAVIVPNGFRGADAPASASTDDGAPANVGGPGTPVSITFLGALYGEGKACALAAAFQKKTGFHRQHPQL